MIFFTDENFIPKVGLILRAYEEKHQIILFTDRFSKGTPDIEWIEAVGKWDDKPVIIGGDGRILKNESERQVLLETGCIYIYLSPGWTNTAYHSYAWKLLKYWPELLTRVSACDNKSVLEISINGKFKRYSLAA